VAPFGDGVGQTIRPGSISQEIFSCQKRGIGGAIQEHRDIDRRLRLQRRFINHRFQIEKRGFTRVTQTLQWWNITEGNSFAPYADEVAQAAWGVSFSLVIAIPAIWAHKYFAAQAEEMIFEMEHLSLAVIEQLSDRRVSSLPNLSTAGYITQRLSAMTTRRLAR